MDMSLYLLLAADEGTDAFDFLWTEIRFVASRSRDAPFLSFSFEWSCPPVSSHLAHLTHVRERSWKH